MCGGNIITVLTLVEPLFCACSSHAMQPLRGCILESVPQNVHVPLSDSQAGEVSRGMDICPFPRHAYGARGNLAAWRLASEIYVAAETIGIWESSISLVDSPRWEDGPETNLSPAEWPPGVEDTRAKWSPAGRAYFSYQSVLEDSARHPVSRGKSRVRRAAQ